VWARSQLSAVQSVLRQASRLFLTIHRKSMSPLPYLNSLLSSLRDDELDTTRSAAMDPPVI
jgi:hypothetical protein